jgi:hypothetical protein
MFEDLMHKASQDSKLFIELVVNFYLDGDAVARNKIEQALFESVAEQGEERGWKVVQHLRQIAAEKGL